MRGDHSDEEIRSDLTYQSRLDSIAYTLFGGFFRGKDATYSRFNRALKQARIPVSYDVYLSRIVLYSSIAAISGIIIGILGTILFGELLLELGLSVNFPPSITKFLESNALLIRGVVVTFVSVTLLFSSVLGILYYWPYYVAAERGREIDSQLPDATTFMYAMSRGGVTVLDVMRAVAESGDTYEHVAEEFSAIVNNVDYVSEDLQTAVREEAAVTPSDELQQFLEDLLNVIDSGSDLEQFFYNKSSRYLDKKKETQEQTLDVLELMSEAYTTLFVASPIFVIVILMVMGLMGSAQLSYMYAMTYFALPVGAVIFTVLMKIINPGGGAGRGTLERTFIDNFVRSPEISDELQSDPRYKKHKRNERIQSVRDLILLPFTKMKETPLYTLFLTVPIAAGYLLFMYFSGPVEVSHQNFVEKPIWATLTLMVIPIYILCLPISILYEWRARKERAIMAKLPEAFKSAAEANQRGLDIQESFQLVAQNMGGTLSKELRYAFQQASWTGNVNDALVGMANRIKVPRLTRTVKVITEANESSGDVQSVLEVAAKDVENVYKLDKKRKQNALTYLIIIIVAFFIALGVIAMLDSAFLTTISSQNSSTSQAGSDSGPGGGGFGSLPVEKFRLAFMHTTMVLGMTAGLVSGAMTNNRAQSGLKFSLVAIVIALVVFAFL